MAGGEGPVLCEVCRKRPARIHIEKLEKGKDKRIFRFCENCAAKCGVVIPDRFLSPHQGAAQDGPIIRMGYAEEDDILEVLSRQLEMPIIDLREVDIDPTTPALLSRSIARRFRCVPVRVEQEVVVVVFADPFDVQAMDEVKAFLESKGYGMCPAIAREEDVEACIGKFYGSAE